MRSGRANGVGRGTALSAVSLPEILVLALERSPFASAAGVVKQSQGQQIAAGAYPNPSIFGSAGQGAIRDPSTGVHVLRAYRDRGAAV